MRLALLHSVGTTTAAAALGCGLVLASWSIGLLGVDARPWAWGAALVIGVVYLPRLMGWTLHPRMLQSCRQVPREWAFNYPRWATAILFGLGLGSGLYTRIVVPTFYLLLVWPFLIGGWGWPLASWSAYGVARSGHLWWLACTAPVNNPVPQMHKINSTLIRRSGSMRRANAALMLAVLLWLVAWRQLG
jgi:hypothetical protein